MQIKIEVSGVAGVPMSGIDIITNKRAIETTALVDNNQIIVLGGLVDEDKQDTVSKVPLLRISTYSWKIISVLIINYC